MKITIIASGTRGDVQPYVALGTGLKAAGHDVRLLSSEDFASLTTGAGLEFHSIGASIEAMIQSEEWRNVLENSNFLTIVSHMQREAKKHAGQMAAVLPDLVAGTELLVGGMGAGVTMAESLNIPFVQAYVYPITPTRAFSSPLTTGLPFGKLLNPLSFHVTRQILWQSGRTIDVALRREMGMSGSPRFGYYGALRKKGGLVLYGYSQQVLPRPSDWDSQTHVTGYWFLPPAANWQPDPELIRFLHAGPPPVYIGFGSMGSRSPEESTQLALAALEKSGQRGLIASGWGGMSQSDLPDSVYMISGAPHTWLFPQMAAVVHHGGAGTTAAGFAAGIPSIITPFMGDQPFWGKRAYDLGVGPAPTARRKLTAHGLAASITHAVTDTAMRRRAALLGERIRAEDGITEAVTLIEHNLPERVKQKIS